jgi:hypothetical protein
MNVVFHSADGKSHDVHVPANTNHVTPELRLGLLRNQLSAFLGAEYDVKMVLAVGM